MKDYKQPFLYLNHDITIDPELCCGYIVLSIRQQDGWMGEAKTYSLTREEVEELVEYLQDILKNKHESP